MAYLTQPDYVQYICSCGQVKPLTNLYFCRHCLKIRCGFCICHEVDSHFCSNCLENMPSSEARLKKNRCISCFECPSCFHTLSTRATMTQPRNQEPAAAGDSKVENKHKKMFYLACFNCRWTSRDVGIPDQPVASGGWPERTNPFVTRFNQLLEYYKAINQQEKQQEKLEKEREKKKFSIRGKYITLTDKTGLTGAMARNLAGMGNNEVNTAINNFVPSQASEQVPGLPDDIFTKEVDLKQITSMPQRLAAPEVQPVLVTRLQPAARALTVKRSQRCRACDHNLTKPEYNPGSIKFKIELLAYYHVPEVKIISLEPLSPGSTSELLIKLTNPTSHEMSVEILEPVEDMDVDGNQTEDGEQPTQYRPPVKPPGVSWARIEVKTSPPLVLSQRDDAAEYDDDNTQAHAPHPMVVWRKCNKMAVRLSVTLSPEVDRAEEATARMSIKYSYRNSLPPSASAQRQQHDHTLYTTVMLNLGLVGI